MADYQAHKEHYSHAYRAGTDSWTRSSFDHRGANLLKHLQPNALILDLGYGRGTWMLYLAKLGYRVVGIDFVSDMKERVMTYAKAEGVAGRVKCVEADVLEISAGENNFDAATDFGLFHNLYPEDWETYKNNILKVLKPKGFLLLEVYSKETQQFYDKSPKASDENRFEKFGVSYHFFTEDDVKKIFGDTFSVIEIEHKFPEKSPAVLSCLLQRK